jgi:cysteinyl-tRNA synthetase
MDMLIRTLIASGLKPKWVMNITDVGHLVSDNDEGEDKLEKGARREGKSAWEIADFYTKDFIAGMKALNILEPDYMPRATEHIAEQIALIKRLEGKGYTYQIHDGIYYDTSRFVGYESFARLDLDEQQAGARVTVNPDKYQQSDFALWKFSRKDKQRDMEWDSPWGMGFPGWHIECSAMSMHYLGPTLDIHTGGIDHVPVHHTNEIAQSEAATGKRFANYWLHSNHVLINGDKISKSSGNGIRLQEVAEKGFSPEILRLHILESHYRSQSKFSWQSLLSAANRLQDLYAISALRYQLSNNEVSSGDVLGKLSEVGAQLTAHLVTDLDTPAALAYLSGVVNQVLSIRLASACKPTLIKMIEDIDRLLGLRLMQVRDITDDQKEKIKARTEARARHDWNTSDKIRDELQAKGVGLNDEPDGSSLWFPLIRPLQTPDH